MGRETGIMRGLVDWLTGGLSARLDFLERDVDALQRDTRTISKNQNGMARVLVDHQRRLDDQADQMIALRRMHGALAERLGEPFPGKACPACGGAMLFEREAAQKSYALTCSAGCKERLLLPEANLLQTLAGRDSAA